MPLLALIARHPVCIGSRRFDTGDQYCTASVPDVDVAAHLRATLQWEAFGWAELDEPAPVADLAADLRASIAAAAAASAELESLRAAIAKLPAKVLAEVRKAIPAPSAPPAVDPAP